MNKLRSSVACLLLAAATLPCFAQTAYSPADADENILLRELHRPGVLESFHPENDAIGLPAYEDREAWRKLVGPDSLKLVKAAEKLLDFQWQIIPATAYLEFERSGDRKAMEVPEGKNRGAMISLILGELAEGKGRFIDQLINGAWQATQQPSWVLSAHQPRQDSGRSLPDQRQPFIDLASGRYGSIMSLTWHFFHKEFDKVDPSISLAIERAVKRNILDSFLSEEDDHINFWEGFGKKGKDGKTSEKYMLNNWTPWCNSDVMVAFFCMEKDPERLRQAVEKSTKSMDLFFNYIKKDGACEEGPGYWDAAAGKAIEWLMLMNEKSGGAFDMSSNNRVRRFSEYISRAYVGNGYVANFADASARRNAPAEHVWIYGHVLHSSELENFGLYSLADARSGKFRMPGFIGNDSYRAVTNFRWNADIRKQVDSLNVLVEKSSLDKVMTDLRKNVPVATWYPETEMCFMRNPSRWFLATKGGFNDESHNHNDIGTFILYIRDIPVFADAGVGTYTKFTFDNRYRYSIWSMQCDWHNLPMYNNVAQQYGARYKAENTSCDLGKGKFSLELKKAYPDSSGIVSARRDYAFATKGKPSLKITDSWSLEKRTACDMEHFLVLGEVILPGEQYNGVTLKEGELVISCTSRDGKDKIAVKLCYPKELTPSVETKELTDRAFSNVWGPSLRRISLCSKQNAPLNGKYSFTITEL